ncbi:MAG: isoprenylcysteine carboxylmethyltransferase family protein [Desulfobacterales bacterium]|nr:isoprenylcysteine carboxylmethyltransferase family protein [Desulfobacterales bacterium]
MNNFQRIFGTGPRGLLFSLTLLFLTYLLEPVVGLPQIHSSYSFGVIIFGFSIVLTFIVIVWSTKSLHPNQRGRELITSGAFKYFRHPLYAAFLIFFNLGLALFLNNYVYVIWAILQHVVWHINIIGEERLMNNTFPEKYRQYCKKTGRFIPIFW